MNKGKRKIVLTDTTSIVFVGILFAGIVFCITPRRLMRLFGISSAGEPMTATVAYQEIAATYKPREPRLLASINIPDELELLSLLYPEV